MSKSIPVTILVSSLILASMSNAEHISLIDCTVLRQTEKAILVEFLDVKGEATGKTEWIPLKACTSSVMCGQTVMTVVKWFNEVVDHDVLNTHFDDFGYSIPISYDRTKH